MILTLTITIVILSLTVLYLVSPKVISYINQKKKEREEQEVTRIHKIIEDYLKKIIND
jgi:hypothetical protein